MKRTETIVPVETRKEMAELMNFVQSLCQEERENLLVFLQGVRFAKSLAEQKTA